jgi:hypothetical protein
LWHDELFTLWAARLSPGNLFDVLRRDSGPPLFYLLEMPFVRLAETIRWDAVVRLLPFGAVFLLLLGLRKFSRQSGGGWTIGLAACSPLLTVYAAEARAYGLLALFTLLLFFLLFRGGPSPARWWSAAVFAAGALWLHYLALFFVAACMAVLLFRRRFLFAGALLVGALTFTPWIPVLAAQPMGATAWMYEPLIPSTVELLSTLGGAGRIPLPLGGPLPAILMTMGAAVGAGLLIAVIQSARRDSECADAAAVTILTMILVLSASLVRPVAFPGRSEMVILPIWLWAVGRAAAKQRGARWLATAAVAVALAASAVLLLEPKPEASPSRIVAAAARVARPGDELIASGAFYLPARLARDRHQLAANLTAFPPDQALHPGWITTEAPSDAAFQTLESVLAAAPKGRRVFVLLPPVMRTAQLDRVLARRGPVRVAVSTPDALVLVCTAS